MSIDIGPCRNKEISENSKVCEGDSKKLSSMIKDNLNFEAKKEFLKIWSPKRGGNFHIKENLKSIDEGNNFQLNLKNKIPLGNKMSMKEIINMSNFKKSNKSTEKLKCSSAFVTMFKKNKDNDNLEMERSVKKFNKGGCFSFSKKLEIFNKTIDLENNFYEDDGNEDYMSKTAASTASSQFYNSKIFEKEGEKNINNFNTPPLISTPPSKNLTDNTTSIKNSFFFQNNKISLYLLPNENNKFTKLLIPNWKEKIDLSKFKIFNILLLHLKIKYSKCDEKHNKVSLTNKLMLSFINRQSKSVLDYLKNKINIKLPLPVC